MADHRGGVRGGVGDRGEGGESILVYVGLTTPTSGRRVGEPRACQRMGGPRAAGLRSPGPCSPLPLVPSHVFAGSLAPDAALTRA